MDLTNVPRVGSPPPSAVRLVNLTPHEVALQTRDAPDAAGDSDVPASGTLRLAPQGLFPRVDDARAKLDRDWLETGTGLVSLTRLKRTSRITDLPAPEPGTRLVVSRITALAARDRADLVFPWDEIRDEAGQVAGARGLGAFRPSWSPSQRYADWRATTSKRPRTGPLNREWLTGVLFVSATALLSGALALLPPAIDNAASNGWAVGQAWGSWVGLASLVLGVALASWGASRWKRRNQILDRMGTAYVIEETSGPWQHEEKESWLAAVREHYAAMLRVPGPGDLGENWSWQLNPDGADRWDDRINQLVRAFWAVHFNDSQITRNALFTWAPWPVAVAFGARATARRRGLVLHVRQRPSYGAAGPSMPAIDQSAHDFQQTKSTEPLGSAARQHTVTCTSATGINLTIEPLTDDAGQERPEHSRLSSEKGGSGSRHAFEPVLLLVRTSDEPIGPIPAGLSSLPPVALGVADALTGSVLPPGTYSVPVAEWRLDSPVSPVPHLPWEAFPAAAEAIAEWIIQQSAGRTVLLATRIPQELGVGLGIQLGRRRREWPRHLYPVVWQRRRLIVPNLELGARSVPQERF